jgi:hypothetical protein
MRQLVSILENDTNTKNDFFNGFNKVFTPMNVVRLKKDSKGNQKYMVIPVNSVEGEKFLIEEYKYSVEQIPNSDKDAIFNKGEVNHENAQKVTDEFQSLLNATSGLNSEEKRRAFVEGHAARLAKALQYTGVSASEEDILNIADDPKGYNYFAVKDLIVAGMSIAKSAVKPDSTASLIITENSHRFKNIAKIFSVLNNSFIENNTHELGKGY